jgi:hypothetical protein
LFFGDWSLSDAVTRFFDLAGVSFLVLAGFSSESDSSRLVICLAFFFGESESE